ncbi:MAG TPA: O-antigen ligase family protein [Aggregatilineaceae bacterium]|nr:O-antigen ligase family protein [Aggregatilineaceae bacterium]
MIALDRRFRPASIAAWGAVAVLLGVLAGRLPVTVAGGGIVLAVLVLAVLIEPRLGLVLMLCVAPLKTLIETEAPSSFPLDVGQFGLALVVLAWAVSRVTARRYTPLPRTRVYLPLIGFMVGFSPSLFNAVSTGAWLKEFSKWIEILLLVVIVLDLGRDRRWTWTVFGVVLSAVLQALIGLYEFEGGSGAPPLWIAGYQHFRAFGTFGQPNPFSGFMGLSLPLALGMAWGYVSEAGRRRRTAPAHTVEWLTPGFLALMYAGFALVLLAGLIVSWGRGAWLGFGAAGTVMVILAPRRWWQGGLLLVAAGALAAALWVTGHVPASIQQRIDSALTEFVGFGDMRGVPISDENFAIVERLAHWQAAYTMASAQPFIGVGLGNYEAVYPEYGLPSWPRPLGHAHNDYLNILAEAGIVGLAFYLVGWAALVYWTLRSLHQPDPVLRGLTLGLLGTWTHLAVHSFVDKLYVNNLFLHIGVMLGLLAVAYSCYRHTGANHEHGVV